MHNELNVPKTKYNQPTQNKSDKSQISQKNAAKKQVNQQKSDIAEPPSPNPHPLPQKNQKSQLMHDAMFIHSRALKISVGHYSCPNKVLESTLGFSGNIEGVKLKNHC